MAEQLLVRLHRYAEEWIEEIDTGDGLQWEMSIFLHPQHGTMVYACFAIPGAVLGTYVNRGVALINPWGLNSDTLKGVFREAQQALIGDRSAQLTAQEPPQPVLGGIFMPPTGN